MISGNIDKKHSSVEDANIDMELISKLLWKWKILILAIVSVSLLCSLIYVSTAKYEYQISFQVTPTQSDAQGVSGNLSGLAGLAGFSLPMGGGENSFALYLEALRSRPTAALIQKDENLIRAMFSGSWSEQEQEWVQRSGVISRLARAVKNVLGMPVYEWTGPTVGDVQDFLRKTVDIDRDEDTSVTTVSMYYSDAQVGVELLTQLNAYADDFVRDRARARTDSYISYLSNKIDQTKIAEYRNALVEEMAKQERLRMRANADLPFAAEPFGTPFASDRPVRPKPVVIIAMAVVGSTLLGMFLAFSLEHYAAKPLRRLDTRRDKSESLHQYTATK